MGMERRDVLQLEKENMEPVESNSSDMVEHPHALALQMVHFFYARLAIAKDAWDITFWNLFRAKHPEVDLGAKELRSHFFHVVMQKVHKLKDLPYAVVQYINPLFNKIREDVLECRDLVEGTDYVYEQDGQDTSYTPIVNNDEPPPLRLQTESAVSPASASCATKRYLTPTAEQIRNFAAAQLSDTLWTNDEQRTKPTLNIDECLLRIAFLTLKNIPLRSCIEPGMACYDHLKQAGLIEVEAQDDEQRSDTNDSTPQSDMPVASSTPASHSRDYDSILKHVRSKPRKGAFKKSTM
uniref:Uncharacterized protein n=1 Tax=Anopheles minimus TaxID=112268 RepID=A0A182WLC3_9DIPT